MNGCTITEPTGTVGHMSSSRRSRIATRARDPRWHLAPLHIEVLDCIDCDRCIPACPPQFGAIFRHLRDVVIVPELCSGCGKCVPACPVDCIHPDPQWASRSRPEEWWAHPGSDHDPYTGTSP